VSASRAPPGSERSRSLGVDSSENVNLGLKNILVDLRTENLATYLKMVHSAPRFSSLSPFLDLTGPKIQGENPLLIKKDRDRSTGNVV
jgi:hypothetical protein